MTCLAVHRSAARPPSESGLVNMIDDLVLPAIDDELDRNVFAGCHVHIGTQSLAGADCLAGRALPIHRCHSLLDRWAELAQDRSLGGLVRGRCLLGSQGCRRRMKTDPVSTPEF